MWAGLFFGLGLLAVSGLYTLWTGHTPLAIWQSTTQYHFELEPSLLALAVAAQLGFHHLFWLTGVLPVYVGLVWPATKGGFSTQSGAGADAFDCGYLGHSAGRNGADMVVVYAGGFGGNGRRPHLAACSLPRRVFWFANGGWWAFMSLSRPLGRR
ncbi:MAG: hypothetical protein M5U34_14215 [Chloroflexi bacterium]|nr:hypothetical protein [Chloroflexota bacterium]